MSCMMLGKEHYQYVADCLMAIKVKYQRRAEFHEIRALFERDTWDLIEMEVIRFANKLQNWNLNAYDTRYPAQADSEYFPDYVSEPKPIGDNLDGCRILKALQCIDYQCSDAALWARSTECALLNRFMEDTKDFIIGELEAYKNAEWGIEHASN